MLCDIGEVERDLIFDLGDVHHGSFEARSDLDLKLPAGTGDDAYLAEID